MSLIHDLRKDQELKTSWTLLYEIQSQKQVERIYWNVIIPWMEFAFVLLDDLKFILSVKHCVLGSVLGFVACV